MKKRTKLQIGFKSGRLTVVNYAGRNKDGRLLVECQCSCGKITVTQEKSVKRGITRSCGCLHLETVKLKAITHGEKIGGKVSKEYVAWQGMKNRCYNQNATGFENYGGRGILVCQEWINSFENFLADMGRCPSLKHSLERDEVNGDYEPSNCRWATSMEQGNNTRRNRILVFNGETRTVCQWARHIKIPTQSLYMRLHRGWSVERAFTQPTQY